MEMVEWMKKSSTLKSNREYNKCIVDKLFIIKQFVSNLETYIYTYISIYEYINIYK